MIRAVFTDSSFVVTGHSGYAASGRDIVCAAVSAMTMLVCNTITEQFKARAAVSSDERDASVGLELLDGDIASRRLIAGLRAELEALSLEYPSNVRVESE